MMTTYTLLPLVVALRLVFVATIISPSSEVLQEDNSFKLLHLYRFFRSVLIPIYYHQNTTYYIESFKVFGLG